MMAIGSAARGKARHGTARPDVDHRNPPITIESSDVDIRVFVDLGCVKKGYTLVVSLEPAVTTHVIK